MRLVEKDDETFEQILKISDAVFDYERPPSGVLRAHYDADDIFVTWRDDEVEIIAFAFVTHRRFDAYLWHFAVAPHAQKNGVGTALLKEVLTEYEKTETKIELTVRVDNVPAQVLYLRNGFRAVRVVPRYYGPEGDGLFMRRDYDKS